MTPTIVLQTKYGYHFYNATLMEFNEHKDSDHLAEFKNIVFNERQQTERKLLQLLDDSDTIRLHKMDDEDLDGWQLFKELSDKYSTLNYFYSRK